MVGERRETFMSNLKIGSVVRLRSGGPEMTIESLIHYEEENVPDTFLCQWFVGGTLQSEVFAPMFLSWSKVPLL